MWRFPSVGELAVSHGCSTLHLCDGFGCAKEPAFSIGLFFVLHYTYTFFSLSPINGNVNVADAVASCLPIPAKR
jgi:hypothetical protein